MTTPLSLSTPPPASCVREQPGQVTLAPVRRPPSDYSLAEIQNLENYLKEVRQSAGKESPEYLELKQHVAEVRMARLPLRTYAMWKQSAESVWHYLSQDSELRALFCPFSVGKKEGRRQFKALLLEKSQSPEIEKKLNFLSRLTLLHGSTSITLAMMALTGKYELQSTGQLLSQGIAPMCGELRRGGLTSTGVNVRFVSVETVRGAKRVAQYSSMPPFNPDRIIFHHRFPLKLKKDDWISFALETRQLQQWDFEAYQQHYSSFLEQGLKSMQEHKDEQEQPLQWIIALIDHPFTDEEKIFVQDALDGKLPAGTPAPSSLAHLFTLSDEIPHLPQLLTTLDNTLNCYKDYYQFGFRSVDWAEFLHGNLKAKLDPTQELLLRKDARAFYQSHLKHTAQIYEFALSLLKNPAPVIKIPSDEKIRSLMTQPIPLIFSSTSVKVFPFKGDAYEANEYLLTKPTPLGKGGCDILFTDTEKSKAKLLAILPDPLKEEIEIHLFDELNVGPIPLIHQLNMIELSNV